MLMLAHIMGELHSSEHHYGLTPKGRTLEVLHNYESRIIHCELIVLLNWIFLMNKLIQFTKFT